MKKITAIFFLSVYLLYATAFGELFKLNVLVRHFHETNNTGNHVGFMSFLVMHYITDDFNEKDNERDIQLPFKSPEISISNCTVLYTTPPFNQLSLTVEFDIFTNPDLISSKDCLIKKDFKSSIWHPPKKLQPCLF